MNQQPIESRRLKCGQRIVLTAANPSAKPEIVTIARWTKVCGERMPDWYIIRFDEGGYLCAHRSNLLIISRSA